MKPWWRSKTIVFNLLSAMLISAETTFPTLKPFLGDVWYGVLFTIVCMINVVLRFITTQPVSGGSDAKP